MTNEEKQPKNKRTKEMTNEEKQKRRDEVEDVLSCFAVIVFMFAMYLAVIVFY